MPMIFLAAVLVVARFTTGYAYSVAASVASILWISYNFRQPFFEFDFLYGDLLMFACMLAVALLTSRMTQRIREQEDAYAEAERERVRGNLLRAVSHDLRTTPHLHSGSQLRHFGQRRRPPAGAAARVGTGHQRGRGMADPHGGKPAAHHQGGGRGADRQAV
jgi:K+-sensing histidine kinase KdpD